MDLLHKGRSLVWGLCMENIKKKTTTEYGLNWQCMLGIRWGWDSLRGWSETWIETWTRRVVLGYSEGVTRLDFLSLLLGLEYSSFLCDVFLKHSGTTDERPTWSETTPLGQTGFFMLTAAFTVIAQPPSPHPCSLLVILAPRSNQATSCHHMLALLVWQTFVLSMQKPSAPQPLHC